MEPGGAAGGEVEENQVVGHGGSGDDGFFDGFSVKQLHRAAEQIFVGPLLQFVKRFLNEARIPGVAFDQLGAAPVFSHR